MYSMVCFVWESTIVILFWRLRYIFTNTLLCTWILPFFHILFMVFDAMFTSNRGGYSTTLFMDQPDQQDFRSTVVKRHRKIVL